VDGYRPQPGDLILVPFGGPAGPFVRVAQALIAGDWSEFCHVEVVVSATQTVGAHSPVACYSDLDDILALRPIAILPVPAGADGPAIAQAAVDLVGTPYQWLAWLWIGLSKLHIRPRWMQRALASPHALICSALGDYARTVAGVHMFQGKLMGAVTPGDLHYVGAVENLHTGPWIESHALARATVDV
jgi:hypothetical protein